MVLDFVKFISYFDTRSSINNAFVKYFFFCVYNINVKRRIKKQFRRREKFSE